MNWLIVILIVAAIAGLIGYFYSDKYGVKYTADKTKLISAPNNLKEYKIPNSVTSIGENAFYECKSLKSIEIPNSVTSIGANPFCGCDKLNDIKINNSNFTFNNGLLISREGVLISCLSNNEKIIIPNTVTSIGDFAFYECKSLKSIEIPNSVTSIGENAFGKCESLKSIEIPNSVTSIGENPFWGCGKLNDIKINNSNFTFNNGLLISREGVLISCLSNNEKIIIPNTITSIGDFAFCECKSLKSIEIPNSVTSIGDFAFGECKSLKSIEIPNSVTSIGDEAFIGCNSLKSIIVCRDNPYLVKKDGEWLLNLPNGEIVLNMLLRN